MISPLRALPLLPVLAATVLSGAPRHALAAAGCEYQQLLELPLRYTGESLSLTVEGGINGAPAEMLVDTGADISMLTRNAAARRDLRLRPTDERVTGIGGNARIYSAWIDRFTVGSSVTTGQNLPVMGDAGSTPSYDAILGSPFLMQHDLEISLATKEIRFFRPQGCQSASLAYWTQDPIVLPYASTLSGSNNPEFKVILNGKELTAVIDSGADTTVITRRVAERIGIKLDAPGSRRIGYAVGGGKRSVARWIATLEKLQIGRETISGAEVGVIDTAYMDIDMLLGADFLRAHRVLFANSQNKLYFTYVGGEPLGQRRSVEAWMQKEADSGNGDAQMLLAGMYMYGQGVPADTARASELVAKADAAGHPRAAMAMAYGLMEQGRHAEAAKRLRHALDRLPGDRLGALRLYQARMHSGETALAKRELAASFKRESADWPGPIADFYLGKFDEERLLKLAQEDPLRAAERACQARRHIAQHYGFGGDEARAAQVRGQLAGCGAE